jgi:hypothetical protein
MATGKLALAILALAGLAACASGSRSDTRREPIRAIMSADALMFVSFDADGDLNVTRAEMEAGMAQEFARADANGDLQIAPIEFQAWSNSVLGGGQMGPYRLDFDRNVDNAITREEFETEVRGRFLDYDTDESDSLSRPEFTRLVGQARPPTVRREERVQPRR